MLSTCRLVAGSTVPVGCRSKIRAAAPATCGAAIDVPLITVDPVSDRSAAADADSWREQIVALAGGREPARLSSAAEAATMITAGTRVRLVEQLDTFGSLPADTTTVMPSAIIAFT